MSVGVQAPMRTSNGALRLELGGHRRRWRMTLRRFRRTRSAQVGLLIIVVLLILSIGAPLFATADPTDMDFVAILQAPSSLHPIGTDDFGRDLLSRVLYGSRISFLIAVVICGATTFTGTLIGSLAAFYPRLDNPLMRVMDVLMAFPPILLAIGIVSILGPQLINIILALIVPYTPVAARVVRGEILALRQLEFVDAARCVGARDIRIIVRHLLPNTLAAVLVQQTAILAMAVLAESSLNFLGIGVPPEIPTLGGILADSRVHLRNAPWMSLSPGIFISLLVLGFNLLGDGLRDILDPHMKV